MGIRAFGRRGGGGGGWRRLWQGCFVTDFSESRKKKGDSVDRMGDEKKEMLGTAIIL